MSPPAPNSQPAPPAEALLHALLDALREDIRLQRAALAAHEAKCDGREERAQKAHDELRDAVHALFGEINRNIERLADKVDGRLDQVHARISALKDGTATGMRELEQRLAAGDAAVGSRVTGNREIVLRWALGAAGVLLAGAMVVIGWAVPLALQALTVPSMATVPFGVPPLGAP